MDLAMCMNVCDGQFAAYAERLGAIGFDAFRCRR